MGTLDLKNLDFYRKEQMKSSILKLLESNRYSLFVYSDLSVSSFIDENKEVIYSWTPTIYLDYDIISEIFEELGI